MQLFDTRIGRKLRAFFTCRLVSAAQSLDVKTKRLPQATLGGRTGRGKGAALPDIPPSLDGVDQGLAQSGTQISPWRSIYDTATDDANACPDEPLGNSNTESGVHHQSIAVSYGGPAAAAAAIPSFQESATGHLAQNAVADGVDTEDAAEGFEVEQVDWTPEQLQEIRETNYRTFCGEDETDYTKGPSRVVLATDGVEECTALLLTLRLSQAVQKAVKAQRTYDKTRQAATQKIAALGRFKHTINAQIRNQKSRIAALKDTGDDQDDAKKIALEEVMSFLELMLEEYQLERTAAENDLTFMGDKLRAVQSQLNALLDDSFTNALLLEHEQEEPEDHPPEYDLQIEYQAFREKMQYSYEGPLSDDTPVLDTSKDHLQAVMSPEECASAKKSEQLHRSLGKAWDRVQSAQWEFDQREDARMGAEDARVARIERGEQPEDATSEAFDVAWLAHEFSLTRNLIEAEQAYDEAQAAVASFKPNDHEADDDSKAESADDYDDGYRLSSQHDAAAIGPEPRIMTWLAGVPDSPTFSMIDSNEAGDEEPDEWEAEEVEFGDGITEILLNKELNHGNPRRTQIDQWHQCQRALAAEFEWMRE